MIKIIYSDLNANAGFEPAEFKNNISEAGQRIMLVLATRKNSRWKRYGFGCYIGRLLFEPCDTHTASKIKIEIEDAIVDYNNGLTDIQISKLEVIPDKINQEFYVNIVFKVGALSSEENEDSLEFNLRKVA